MNTNNQGVKIIPLGGLEQNNGMNITAFEYGDSIIIVDCGLAFPDGALLGIDWVIPDLSYIKANASKVKGLFITHGHEDHIGAIPYLFKDVQVPIYATQLTMGLIDNLLEKHNMLNETRRKVVSYGQFISMGDFRVEFIKTNHTISDAAALAIYTPEGIIIHTGDFKIDYTPVFGDTIDLGRFAELGKKGVLALMCDSTNAGQSGFSPSEKSVALTMDRIFNEHKDHRIIVATYASNVDRVQSIINAASKYGKKVLIEGRSMVQTIETAIMLEYLNLEPGILINAEDLPEYKEEDIVLIIAGSQGETMGTLTRMAEGAHSEIFIGEGDVVVLSTHALPGNEKAVSRMMNAITRRGGKIISTDTDVSGHACQEEIKLIYSLTKPKFSIPIHGEYRHRKTQKEIAIRMGVEKENVFVLKNGEVLTLNKEKGVITDNLPSMGVFVDGLGVGDIGNIVLRDRQFLSKNGLFIIVLTLEGKENRLVAGPDIVSRGFVYVRQNEELIEEAKDIVRDCLDACNNKGIYDWSYIKNEVRTAVSDYIWKRMKRSPLILPIIMEV